MRSAKAAVVKFSNEPSERGNTRFEVATPRVVAPNKRVDERPRNAIATASPELAVVGPTKTATGGASTWRVTGAIFAAVDGYGARLVEANYTKCSVTNTRYVTFDSLNRNNRWTLYRLTL